MLANKPRSFKYSCVIKTGLPDLHRMTFTVMNATFQPRVVNYREYKYFENYRFRADLLPELSKTNNEEKKEGLSDFLNTCKSILDLHAPRKQKYARGLLSYAFYEQGSIYGNNDKNETSKQFSKE